METFLIINHLLTDRVLLLFKIVNELVTNWKWRRHLFNDDHHHDHHHNDDVLMWVFSKKITKEKGKKKKFIFYLFDFNYFEVSLSVSVSQSIHSIWKTVYPMVIKQKWNKRKKKRKKNGNRKKNFFLLVGCWWLFVNKVTKIIMMWHIPLSFAKKTKKNNKNRLASTHSPVFQKFTTQQHSKLWYRQYIPTVS